jgi:TPR repeat protein
MAKVSPIATESKTDWYDTITKEQSDGVDLKPVDQQIFHAAFECFSSGNYPQAYMGMKELAEKGSSNSQYFLGVMCLKGMGVLQDFSKAHMWFNLSASRGHNKARSHLEKLTQKMGADQIAEAQRLARDWVAREMPDI